MKTISTEQMLVVSGGTQNEPNYKSWFTTGGMVIGGATGVAAAMIPAATIVIWGSFYNTGIGAAFVLVSGAAMVGQGVGYAAGVGAFNAATWAANKMADNTQLQPAAA
jgi:hypothetical protein